VYCWVRQENETHINRGSLFIIHIKGHRVTGHRVTVISQIKCVRSEVLMEVTITSSIFWDISSCGVLQNPSTKYI
jgi:hypothetical protein